MKIVKATNLDLSKITYSELKPYGDKAKIMYVNYESEPLYIDTRTNMVCPYGLSMFDNDGRIKYSLDLSFGNGDNNKVNDLKKALEKIDEKILKDSTKNSLEWFKKKSQSKDVSKALYTSSVKIATENGEPTDKYPPTFKLKVPCYEGRFDKVQAYTENKEKITEPLGDVIGKGQNVRAIVKLAGVWFAGGKFGVTWELSQLKLTPRPKIKEYAFDDGDEGDDDVSGEEDVSPKIGDGDEYVLDSEEDEL